MKIIFLFIITIFIFGCANKDFKVGDCIISPDGFIWKISIIQNDNYIAEQWMAKSWKNKSSLKFKDVSLSNGFGVTACR